MSENQVETVAINQAEDPEKAKAPNTMDVDAPAADNSADTTKVDAVTTDPKAEVDPSLQMRL